MPEQLNQSERRRLLIRTLDDAVSQFGFRYHAGAYFSRERNALVDAFFFQFSRSNSRFTLTYGLSAPTLLTQILDNATLNPDSKYPSLTISPQIAEQNEFGCKYEEHLLNLADQITTFFSDNVVPWLDRFQTPGAVVAEYHRLNIGKAWPDETDADRKVLLWTVYGLMLYNLGHQSDSVPWLDAAFQYWSSQARLNPNQEEWLRIIASTGIGPGDI